MVANLFARNSLQRMTGDPRFDHIDVGAAYRDLRLRVMDLTSLLTPEEWEGSVPHCPEWTVREVLAHLAGIVDDGMADNMSGVATPEWTAAQVRKRAAMSGPEIALEWATYAPFVEARATEKGMALSQLVFDATMHEHDLRYALGRPGARDCSSVMVALGFFVGLRAARPGGMSVQVRVDGREIFDVCQPGAPVLEASAFDTIRMFGSRRSRAQVESMRWSRQPGNALDSLPAFGYPPAAIAE